MQRVQRQDKKVVVLKGLVVRCYSSGGGAEDSLFYRSPFLSLWAPLYMAEGQD